MKRCLIIYNKPNKGALIDEADVLDQVCFVENVLLKNGYSVERLALTCNFYREIFTIKAECYHFVFNLVESVWKHDELLHIAPSLLKIRNIRYSGCSAEAIYITADKMLTKNFLKMSGIRVPSGYRISDWNLLKQGKYYIVKPIAEDGSVGITEESVFMFSGSKPTVLKDKDDSNWFIEEYINGRELNISLIATSKGPLVLRPAEILFMHYPVTLPKIMSYKAKWDVESFQYKNSVRSFDTTYSNELFGEINSISLKCWDMFNLHGYARIDIRIDSNNHVYVIEINANPCISADSGFVAACHNIGISDNIIISNIISDLN